MWWWNSTCWIVELQKYLMSSSYCGIASFFAVSFEYVTKYDNLFIYKWYDIHGLCIDLSSRSQQHNLRMNGKTFQLQLFDFEKLIYNTKKKVYSLNNLVKVYCPEGSSFWIIPVKLVMNLNRFWLDVN